jgi:hypothetical protein
METQGLGTGHIDPFWNDEYKQLNYRQEKFNNPKDLTRWRSEGYVHPDSHFTGAMCDMRSPQPSWNSQLINWAASAFDIIVKPEYVELLGQIIMLIVSAYFGGRTLEKIMGMKAKEKDA